MNPIALRFAFTALSVAACAAGYGQDRPAPPRAAPLAEHWVGTWATAPQLTEPGNLPPPPGMADTTLRQIVHVSLGGKRLRVRLTNSYGTKPLTITAAHVAVSAGGDAIRPETDTALAFSGRPSVTIPPGALMVSDPVNFPLRPLSDLAVTVHVRDATMEITGHPGSRTTTYLTAGDFVSAARLPAPATTAHWYYINGIDVTAGDSAGAVAALGDSITDGRGSTTDRNDRWPDVLAGRLQENRGTAGIAVLNAGIGGNRVLNDGLGPSALARLDRDVLAQPGVRWLILFEGINDLGTHSASAEDLIAAYRQIITRAHARGIRVYGGTITPCGGSFYDNPDLEAARQTINAWVRTGGEFDGVIDFDAAVRDSQNPHRLRAEADSGDHLHLNPIGYKIMAEAVDLRLFTK